MPLDNWIIYFTTVFIASIIPGPSMLLALTHGMQFGVRKAAISSFGVIISTMTQAGISIAGLGAILLASELLFIIVKISGALYLIYLGVMVLLSSGSFYTEFKADLMTPTFRRLLSQGLMVSIFNPKAVIFFTAFFPQFIDTSTASASGYIIMLVTLAAVHFGCSMVYAFSGKQVVAFFRKSGRVISKAIGVFFVLTGLSVIFTSVWNNNLTIEKE